MRIGIFAKTFPRSGLAETLDAVLAHGLTDVQFNLSCVGLPTLPLHFDARLFHEVADALATRGLTMAAVSGTFNMAHPDAANRKANLASFWNLAWGCEILKTSIITLCSGSRDPDDLWRFHPENGSAAAWKDLVATLNEALKMAADRGLTLAFEPEVANVIDSAARARRLLDEMDSPHLKVVIDPANLFRTGDLPRMREVLGEAFDLLQRDIVLAHAKDLSQDGAAEREAAGTGRLDYRRYLDLLTRSGYEGPLILHGLREDQVAASLDFLRKALAES